MTDDIFSKRIGDKESKKSLVAKPVRVLGFKAEPIKGKEGGKRAGQEIGKKLVIICKHPDRDEPVNISSMTFIAGKSVKTSTMWINVDEDGNIEKGSSLAILLQRYNKSTIKELEGTELITELDESKFLAIKCY